MGNEKGISVTMWIVNIFTEVATPIKEEDIKPLTDGQNVYVRAKDEKEAISESKLVF